MLSGAVAVTPASCVISFPQRTHQPRCVYTSLQLTGEAPQGRPALWEERVWTPGSEPRALGGPSA